MITRALQEEDVPAALGFLEKHVASAMFPLVNLREHGLSRGKANPAPRALHMYGAYDGNRITDLLGVTAEGLILPVLPDGDCGLWALLRADLPGHPALGAAGVAAQVRDGLSRLGLSDAPMRLGADEPHYALSLEDLVPPKKSVGTLISIRDADRALMVSWRAAYGDEVMGLADPAQAGRDIETYTKQDSHRVLVVEGEPVAMTGFNARTDTHVQVGGVYCPPALRGRGYASQAVALHLAEARSRGATHGILFAASQSAARIYERLGFLQIGHYALVIFERPQEIPA